MRHIEVEKVLQLSPDWKSIEPYIEEPCCAGIELSLSLYCKHVTTYGVHIY